MINGTEIADQPKAALFGQKRASIRGIETTPSKPKGHHVAGNAKIGNEWHPYSIITCNRFVNEGGY